MDGRESAEHLNGRSGRKQGAFAGFVSFGLGERLRHIHQLLAYLLLAMIAAHLAGVLPIPYAPCTP